MASLGGSIKHRPFVETKTGESGRSGENLIIETDEPSEKEKSL